MADTINETMTEHTYRFLNLRFSESKFASQRLMQRIGPKPNEFKIIGDSAKNIRTVTEGKVDLIEPLMVLPDKI